MKRVLLLASAALLVLAVTAGAQGRRYVIKAGTGSGMFSATVNNNPVAGATDVTLDGVIKAIREGALGDPVTIQFGDNKTADSVLNVGATGRVTIASELDVTPAWGDVTLEGSLKTENTYGAVVYLQGNAALPRLNVVSSVNIAGNPAGNTGGISANNNVSLKIVGGVITATGWYEALYCYETAVTIEGGTFSSEGSNTLFVGTWSDSSVAEIKGGTFTSSESYAAYFNGLRGGLQVTGGKFEAAKVGQTAVSVAVKGKAVISGAAEIISASDSVMRASLEISEGELVLDGGKVTNKTEGGRAVYVSSSSGRLALSGATPPALAGNVATRFPNALRADASFKPGSNKYTLELLGGACNDSAVAVAGGGGNLSAFVLAAPASTNYELAKRGDDIIVKLKSGIKPSEYIIIGDTAALYKAAVVGGTDTLARAGGVALSDLLDSVRANAQGKPCNITFGVGGAVLNARPAYVSLSSSSTIGWGRLSLKGKLAVGGLNVYDGLSVENTADIAVGSGTYIGSVYVSSGADFTNKSGTLNASIYNYAGTVTVAGGTVVYIYNDGSEGNPGSLVVTGGTVGDTLRQSFAIENGGRYAQVVISGGTVISKDTTTTGSNGEIIGGTIKNRGALVISGGKVSNVLKGYYSIAVNNGIYESDTTASAVITGTAELTAKNTGSAGVVFNGKGVMTISGGKIRDGRADTSYVLVQNRAVMTISDSADIAAAPVNQWSAVVSYASGTGESEADTAFSIPMRIIGGKIDGANALAVFSTSGSISISGTAKLTSAGPEGVVGSNGSGHIYLLGGEITSTAKDSTRSVRAVNNWISGRTGPGKLTMGGSPTVSGGIIYNSTYPLNILVTGASRFAPGSKKYTIGSSSLSTYTDYNDNNKTYPILLKNGAGAVGSFILDSATYAESSPKPLLAVSGNEGVLTTEGVWQVSFSLNGGTGTAPAPFSVVRGGVLGELARPATTPYYITKDGKKYKNDDEWHIQNGELGGEEIVGAVYIFNKSVNVGTPITEGKILTLKWTNEAYVSVLASNREVPAAQAPAVAVIKPVAVTAGELTAGPNPSALRAGKVSFFWNGAQLKGGKLVVFDAAGRAVAKVSVSDVGAAGKRAVAVWNLTDAKGRPVAEGTYAAKGVVNTKSGKAEKVSILLGVR